MDERTRLFLWLLASDGVFALLGGVFGALTAVVHARQGRGRGTSLGHGVVRAYDRLAETRLSADARAALAGGTDGLLFGVVVGTLIGLVVAWHGPAAWNVFRPIVLTALFLVGLAILLGLFAVHVARVGTRAVVGLFLGGMAGALLGFAWAGADGLFVGALLCAGVGAALTRVVR